MYYNFIPCRNIFLVETKHIFLEGKGLNYIDSRCNFFVGFVCYSLILFDQYGRKLVCGYLVLYKSWDSSIKRQQPIFLCPYLIRKCFDYETVARKATVYICHNKNDPTRVLPDIAFFKRRILKIIAHAYTRSKQQPFR